MFVFVNRYRNVVAFICFCTISLILSWLTLGAARTASDGNAIKNKVSPLLVPAYFCSSIISSIWSKAGYAGSVMTSVWKKPLKEKQFKQLEGEVEHLKRQLAMERSLYRRQLRELRAVYSDLAGDTAQIEVPFRLISAKVIAVEPTDWFRYITIDKGRGDGVKVDMAVITSSDEAGEVEDITGTVVGKVVKVQDGAARVQLITDRLSVVAVTIGSQGDLVLMRGQPETENCAIDAIPSTTYEMLELDNPVVVDERSSIFPSGMLVGRISDIETGTHFCRVEVQPTFKFSKLREVMVVMDRSQ